MAKERLQKVLARAGVASRRGSEQIIAAGRVRVNGKIVSEQGVKVDPHKDKVEVDGRRIVAQRRMVFAANKPRGMVSTFSDPEGRKTLQDLITPEMQGVHAIGRLDFNTSGVMLFTNDGALTQALLKPDSGVPKTYVAKIQGHFDVEELDLLRNGVELDDGYITKKANVFVERTEKNNTWLNITLHEGKNRQIHRMAEALNRRVLRLVRVSFAGIDTSGLPPGRCRPLKARELEKIEKRYVRK